MYHPMKKKLMMISALAVMAVTLSIGLTPAASAWYGHDAWDIVNVIVPTSGSSTHTHTEPDCGVVTKVSAGSNNYISWDAPETCDDEVFEKGRAMLYINDEYIKYYMFYDDEYVHSWSHGESVSTGDKVEAFNLYYYEPAE